MLTPLLVLDAKRVCLSREHQFVDEPGGGLRLLLGVEGGIVDQ
jgi:hypothetical protein